MDKPFAFYGKGIPRLVASRWPGSLIVVEGADGVGRSTHMRLVRGWLEASGLAVTESGLRRSTLVKGAIEAARKQNVQGQRTMSLLYATDLADQLESEIIPALKAGFVVLADRYIFTLMARDLVRGVSADWLKELLGFALVPNLTLYLRGEPEDQLHRSFAKTGHLDYWESGMDLGLSRDMFDSFLIYQQRLRDVYDQLAVEYGFVTVNASQSVETVQQTLRSHLQEFVQEAVRIAR